MVDPCPTVGLDLRWTAFASTAAAIGNDRSARARTPCGPGRAQGRRPSLVTSSVAFRALSTSLGAPLAAPTHAHRPPRMPAASNPVMKAKPGFERAKIDRLM
jgi:hypothetical protein